MGLDLAVLAVLAVASVAGALSGALRQLVSLAAAVVGWLAARHLGGDVAAGFARSIPDAVARVLAPALLFLGAFALASLAGGLLLRSSGLSKIVRGPSDRGAGALLGGLKGALGAWVLLSALALAGSLGSERIGRWAAGSDLLALARVHNLLVRLDPATARAFERALAAARSAEKAGALARDPESARLLSHPSVRALLERAGDRPADAAELERLLADPEVRALVERLVAREKGEGRAKDAPAGSGRSR